MEKWNEIFIGEIPKNDYLTEITSSEEKGLIVELISEKNNVIFDFGSGTSYRVLDEGLLLNENSIFNNIEVENYRKKNFNNTIYEIENGQFSEFAKKISNDMYSILDMKHYILITMNYLIEVVSENVPEFTLNYHECDN